MTSQVLLRRILPGTIATLAMVLLLWVTFGQEESGTTQQEVRRLYRRGDYEIAERQASALLDRDPGLDEIRFIAADSAAQMGDFNRAMQHLNLLKTDQDSIALKASLLTAKLAHFQTLDFRIAESGYKTALTLDPHNVDALEGLVRLLAVCGRRREAIPLLLQLVKDGFASDLLTIAARGSGTINDPEFLRSAYNAFPTDSRTLVGLAVIADRSGDWATAVNYCRSAIASDPEFAPAMVDLGQYLLAADRFEELDEWEQQLFPQCREFAEAWRVQGYLAERHGKMQQALEYFLEAARRGPELKDVHYRLSQLFQRAGDAAGSTDFSNRLLLIQQLETQQDKLFASGPQNVDQLLATVDAYRALGRLWEACGWAQIGQKLQPKNEELLQLLSILKAQTNSLALELVVSNANPAFRYAADNYTLPDTIPTENRGLPSNMSSPAMFEFRDDASATALHFEYINGVSGPTTHRMFEFTGGGIGVVDFDHDDYPDLFLTQGGLWETRGTGRDANDMLFRNVRGNKFSAAESAGISESEFGQGVAVGDLNEDGFSDAFVGNIGQNGMWINNGDGTFTDRRDLIHDFGSDDTWTTSALIADLNHDGAADIYAANYLGGSDVFDRICRGNDGSAKACIPVHFDAVQDSLLLGKADGSFENASETLRSINPGKGLGVLAWSPTNDGMLSVFVANDTTPNMLLHFDKENRQHVADTGFASGIAVSAEGKSQGCMGIAASDLNADGLLDIVVTNFYNESNTLYQSMGGTSFEDATKSVRLDTISTTMLGFGVQFIDANLDGAAELVVANGHVDDLRREGKPYEMPAQLLTFHNGVFEDVSSKMKEEYFAKNHLGRSVVRLDWNIDGLPDLMVGHLSEPYALLTNRCPDHGHFVTLKLIGTRSGRDAIGTTVSYEMSGQTFTNQVTAGDGYHASNERELSLSCGSLTELEQVVIQWPSGETQTMTNILTNRRYVLREGDQRLYLLP